jgi:hypothetical protein
VFVLAMTLGGDVVVFNTQTHPLRREPAIARQAAYGAARSPRQRVRRRFFSTIAHRIRP